MCIRDRATGESVVHADELSFFVELQRVVITQFNFHAGTSALAFSNKDVYKRQGYKTQENEKIQIYLVGVI